MLIGAALFIDVRVSYFSDCSRDQALDFSDPDGNETFSPVNLQCCPTLRQIIMQHIIGHHPEAGMSYSSGIFALDLHLEMNNLVIESF